MGKDGIRCRDLCILWKIFSCKKLDIPEIGLLRGQNTSDFVH